MFVALKPQARARAARATVHCAAAPRDQQRRRHGGLLPDDPEHQSSAAASPRASTSTRCNRARPRRSISSRRRCATRSPRSPGLRDVNTDLYITNPQVDDRGRSREGGGLRHHRSIRSARSCTTPSAPARSRRSTRRATTTRSSWRPSRNSRPIRRACRRSIVKTNGRRRHGLGARRPGGRRHRQRHPDRQSIPLSAVTKPVPRSGRCRSTTRASSRR